MNQRPNGGRLISAYPKLGIVATQAVDLKQPDRDKAPKESTVPEFLRGFKGWKPNGR